MTIYQRLHFSDRLCELVVTIAFLFLVIVSRTRLIVHTSNCKIDKTVQFFFILKNHISAPGDPNSSIFLATLVALQSTPVSESVSQSLGRVLN